MTIVWILYENTIQKYIKKLMENMTKNYNSVSVRAAKQLIMINRIQNKSLHSICMCGVFLLCIYKC